MFHSVDFSPSGLKSYCSFIGDSKFLNEEKTFSYSSLPFNMTSQIFIGRDIGGSRTGCAKISNAKISLQYFNSNYVTGFMSDIYSN